MGLCPAAPPFTPPIMVMFQVWKSKGCKQSRRQPPTKMKNLFKNKFCDESSQSSNEFKRSLDFKYSLFFSFILK